MQCCEIQERSLQTRYHVFPHFTILQHAVTVNRSNFTYNEPRACANIDHLAGFAMLVVGLRFAGYTAVLSFACCWLACTYIHKQPVLQTAIIKFLLNSSIIFLAGSLPLANNVEHSASTCANSFHYSTVLAQCNYLYWATTEYHSTTVRMYSSCYYYWATTEYHSTTVRMYSSCYYYWATTEYHSTTVRMYSSCRM